MKKAILGHKASLIHLPVASHPLFQEWVKIQAQDEGLSVSGLVEQSLIDRYIKKGGKRDDVPSRITGVPRKHAHLGYSPYLMEVVCQAIVRGDCPQEIKNWLLTAHAIGSVDSCMELNEERHRLNDWIEGVYKLKHKLCPECTRTIETG